jgi:hypothetical protein
MHYSQEYDNSLYFSPRFRSYAESLAHRLVESYDLFGKQIIEIGSGRGDFLKYICELGESRGTGFDPSYAPDVSADHYDDNVHYIKDYFSAKYYDYPADLVISRHVLEHIEYPREFLSTIRKSVGDNSASIVFIEVPNFRTTLQDQRIFDIIYEHYSYFNSFSLAYLCRMLGFEILEMIEAFGDQFLSADLRIGPIDILSRIESEADYPANYERYIGTFAENYRDMLTVWKERIKDLQKSGRKVVAWGAGAKGLSFLNFLNIRGEIDHIVDINPRKQGKFIAGTGQHIVPPDFLTKYLPDVVIVMNAIYKEEIKRNLEDMNLKVDLICI